MPVMPVTARAINNDGLSYDVPRGEKNRGIGFPIIVCVWFSTFWVVARSRGYASNRRAKVSAVFPTAIRAEQRLD